MRTYGRRYSTAHQWLKRRWGCGQSAYFSFLALPNSSLISFGVKFQEFNKVPERGHSQNTIQISAKKKKKNLRASPSPGVSGGVSSLEFHSLHGLKGGLGLRAF